MFRFSLIPLFLIIVSGLESQGQTVRDLEHAEDSTNSLYQSGLWEQLVELGESAIDSGYDSYYLRLRIGIALFRQENYRAAIVHLNEAVVQDLEDVIALEYLYLAFLLSGRSMDASLLFHRNWHDLSTKISRSDDVLKSIYIEGALKLSRGSREVRNMFFNQTGFALNAGAHLGVFTSYSYVEQDLTSWFDTDGLPGTSAERSFNYDFRQHEYYLRTVVVPEIGWRLIPAVHYQWVDVVTGEMTNWVYYLAIQKELGMFTALLGGGLSRLNRNRQAQLMAGFTFYPGGNLDVYARTRVTAWIENGKHETILKQRVGWKVMERTWLEGIISLGNILNFHENDAMYVYNSLDVIESRYGITLTRELGRHFLYLNYTLENKLRYQSRDPFNHHGFAAGLNINL